MPTSSRSWADLPAEPLRLIARDLAFADYVAFKLVCSNWSAALAQPQEVWLVGHLSNWIFSCITFQFYRVVRDQLLLFPGALSLDLICCGSSRGWLLLANNPFTIPRLLLYHPLYQSFIELPASASAAPTDPRSQFAPATIQKFVLSADPATSPADWIAFAFAVAKDPAKSSRPDYAFYRPGNPLWTLLAPSPDAEASCPWPDVAFHRGKFYVATHSQLLVCELGWEQPAPPRLRVLERVGPAVRSGRCRTFLVERGAELLFVSLSRSLANFPNFEGRRELEVYKVKFLDSDRVEFLKQEGVGDHALFLGENHSFALDSMRFPSCRRNTVYFPCQEDSHILLIDLESKMDNKSKIPAIRYPAPLGFSVCPCYWFMRS